jgi:rod shape-determining protein MreC
VPYGDQKKHFEHLKLPVTWGVMGVVGIVCVVAALLFIGDHRDQVDQSAYANRAGFDTVASVPNKILDKPVQVVGDGTSSLSDYFFAVRENRILKKKVQELSQYRDAYLEMKDVNERYEKLLNLRTEPPVETVTARSVLVSRGPFNNNRLIDAGSDKHIAFGNPVITDQGLVGRVVGISPNVSRVLMVTDISSHVPVMIMRSDGRAMMDGDGGGYPKLSWVRGRDTVREGDQILTSGDGGVFPRGLPVGEAVKGVDGVWRVRLYANRGPIDFVKVLLFKDFSQLPDASTLLRSPPVSAILPKPPMPQVTVMNGISGSASASSSASASASSGSPAKPAAKPAATPTPAVAAGTPAAAVAKPAAAKPRKPAAPKPAATHSDSSSADAGTLKPFVPSSSVSGATSSGNGQ